MSLTREQILNGREFHANGCTVSYGKTGKAQPKVTVEIWRRNGQTQLWKTRPTEFRIPIKHGLYAYGEITDRDVDTVHAAEDCAPMRAAQEYWNARRAQNEEVD